MLSTIHSGSENDGDWLQAGGIIEMQTSSHPTPRLLDYQLVRASIAGRTYPNLAFTNDMIRPSATVPVRFAMNNDKK
jgi:hypothetical protein